MLGYSLVLMFDLWYGCFKFKSMRDRIKSRLKRSMFLRLCFFDASYIFRICFRPYWRIDPEWTDGSVAHSNLSFCWGRKTSYLEDLQQFSKEDKPSDSFSKCSSCVAARLVESMPSKMGCFWYSEGFPNCYRPVF